MNQPDNLGRLPGGQLKDCGVKPNCVCSCASRDSQRVPAIPLCGSIDESFRRLIEVVSNQRGATIVTQVNNQYVRVEFRSRLFRFVDDVEFSISEAEQVIHVRSAARVGHGDLGVNRRRVIRIASQLQALSPVHRRVR
jgi:uncharacterized protein (DUF1499 family)